MHFRDKKSPQNLTLPETTSVKTSQIWAQSEQIKMYQDKLSSKGFEGKGFKKRGMYALDTSKDSPKFINRNNSQKVQPLVTCSLQQSKESSPVLAEQASKKVNIRRSVNNRISLKPSAKRKAHFRNPSQNSEVKTDVIFGNNQMKTKADIRRGILGFAYMKAKERKITMDKINQRKVTEAFISTEHDEAVELAVGSFGTVKLVKMNVGTESEPSMSLKITLF